MKNKIANIFRIMAIVFWLVFGFGGVILLFCGINEEVCLIIGGSAIFSGFFIGLAARAVAEIIELLGEISENTAKNLENKDDIEEMVKLLAEIKKNTSGNNNNNSAQNSFADEDEELPEL